MVKLESFIENMWNVLNKYEVSIKTLVQNFDAKAKDKDKSILNPIFSSSFIEIELEENKKLQVFEMDKKMISFFLKGYEFAKNKNKVFVLDY